MPSIDTLSIRISASTSDANTKVKALTESLNSLVTAINALDVSKFEALSNATNGLSQGLAGLKGSGVKQIEKVGKAINSVNEAAQKDTLDAVANDVKKVSDKSKEASESLDSMGNKIGEFSATDTIDEMSRAMERVSETVKKTSNQMGAFKTLLAKTKIIIPTDGLEKVDKRINSLTEKIEDLKDRLNFKKATQADYIDSAEMEKDQQKIDGLINELERLKLKKQELESHGGFKLNLGNSLTNLRKGFETVNKKLDDFVSKIRRAKNHTKDTAKATNNFSLASMKLAKELTRVTKMLKLMITRMILRKVIQNAIDGFKNLVQYSSEVDASVSLMWNSFRQLGNAVAAAVGPLISALAPALNYIIQLCIKVANAINQVISALLGRSTWTKAKTLTDDYGASLDKANKSAKDLKRTILGFDEINQLQDNKDSGGGGGMTKPEDMFEDAKIESKWKDLAAKLKKILNQLLAPIKKAWANVGDEVVAAWKGAFESVKKLLEDIGRDFLKVWNQPQTVKMLENILRIFRDIGNIIKNLANGLDEAWNKNKTGLHILEAIRDIFAIVIQHVQNMTEATAEWAENLDFSPILEAFKNWLESLKPVVDAIAGSFEDFYTKVLLPLSKWSLEEGLPELIQVFIDFNNKVEWDTIRARLNRLWEALEPFAKKVGEGLVIFIRDVSDAVANFLNSDKWDAFIDTLIKWMKDVDPDEVARGIKIVAGAIITLKSALFLLEGIKGLTALVSTLKSFFGIFAAGGTAAGAAETITTTATAIGKLHTALRGLVGTAIGVDLFKNIKDMFKLSGLKEEFENGEISVKGFLDKLKELGGLGQSQGSLAVLDSYSKEVKNLNEAYDAGTLSTQEYQSALSNVHEKYKLQATELTPLQKETRAIISDYAQGIITTKEYKEKLAALDEKYKGHTTTVQDAGKKVQDTVNSIKTSSKVITMEIPSEVYNATNEITGYEHTLSKDTTDSMNEIQTTVNNSMNEVNKSFDTVKDGMSEDKWTFKGVADGLKKTFQDAIDGIKGLWNTFVNKLNGDYKIGSIEIPIHLPTFAHGGFPEDDSLFMANSTEMLGKFSNGRNVVANNQQITDGIAQAVYSAMMSANGGNGSGRYINNTIQIDGRTIARAVTMGQNDMNRRYSPVTT